MLIQLNKLKLMTPKSIISLRKAIGKHLKSARQKKELSSYAVAKMSGISITQLKSIESGNKAYTIDSLLKLQDALNLLFSIDVNF